MGESYSQTATQPLDSPDIEDNTYEEEMLPQYWGRLYPAQRNVKFHELKEEVVTVGKLTTCEVSITSEEVPGNFWVVISRKHFSISRIQQEVLGKTISAVQLTDLSMNGTFINGRKVGKGQSKDLEDNDLIAVGKPQFKVYYYKKASVSDLMPRMLQNKYDVSTRLGTGAFGEVHLVFHKETGKPYAMKTILNEGLKSQKKVDNELQKLENEVKILRSIKHPNVIQLIDDMNFDSRKFLFLELMEGSDLFNRIQTCKRLTERQAKLYFYQIASGVRYLHSQGIIHRDLKPENVLLATEDTDTLVKITDFGLSKKMFSKTYLLTLCGTKLYVAPEVLESGESRRYNGQVDVWSMGVILYVSLSGQSPFASDKKGLTMEEQIKKGQYSMPPSSWECVSNGAKNLVKRMMTPNPLKRITINGIFNDSWLEVPLMKSKVEDLICQLRVTESDKENVPRSRPEQASEPSSPLPASIRLMSPPNSPPRKRGRLERNAQL